MIADALLIVGMVVYLSIAAMLYFSSVWYYPKPEMWPLRFLCLFWPLSFTLCFGLWLLELYHGPTLTDIFNGEEDMPDAIAGAVLLGLVLFVSWFLLG